MTPKIRLTALALVVTALAGQAWAVAETQVEFTAPKLDAPKYAIHVPLTVPKGTIRIKTVDVNGSLPLLVQFLRPDKKIADPFKPLAMGIYDVVIEFAWKSKTPYKVTLVYDPQTGAKDKTETWSATSPDEGGIPAAAEDGFYRAFKVEETAGLERRNEIVTLTLTAPKSDIEKPAFGVWDSGRPVPYQVIDIRESTPLQSQAATHPLTLTYKLALPLDSAPRQKKLIFVLKGGGAPTAEQGLTVSGEGFGKTITSSRMTVRLHPQSGQINVIEYLKEGIKIHNEKAGVVHWNPDVYVPGIAWDHSFDWNPPQSLAEKNGPFVYLNARKGPMPRVKDVSLEVRYAIEKDAPYIVAETLLSVGRDMGVIALRNDEMVFYRRLFDSLLYKDPVEGVVRRPLLELDGFPNGLAHIAPADAEWVGLINTMNRYGFFSVRLSSVEANLDAAGTFLHKPGTYFYAPSDGEYVYWVRPLLYTWAEYATNTKLTFLPQGSFFYEKNAYVLVPLDDKTTATLDELAARLKNPLRVF